MSTSARGKLRDFAYRHLGGSGIVLTYHRVTEIASDPQSLAVSPAHFEEQMRMLSETGRVIPLSELADGLARKTVSERPIVITFDDGYADNLHKAAPVLVRYRLPATVFVSSGFVGTDREYWWDELERLILSAEGITGEFALEVDGAALYAVLSPDSAGADSGWWMGMPPFNERQQLYVAACDLFRPLSAEARERALEQLRLLADSEPHARPTHRPLSADELSQLAATPGIEVGGHTVSHQRLVSHSPEQQQKEIAADRESLAAALGQAPRFFSYPYGGLDDYTDRSVDAVRATGYAAACSNHPGVVKPWTDRFRIPRNLVRDWSAAELSGRIQGWLDEPR